MKFTFRLLKGATIVKKPISVITLAMVYLLPKEEQWGRATKSQPAFLVEGKAKCLCTLRYMQHGHGEAHSGNSISTFFRRSTRARVGTLSPGTNPAGPEYSKIAEAQKKIP